LPRIIFAFRIFRRSLCPQAAGAAYKSLSSLTVYAMRPIADIDTDMGWARAAVGLSGLAVAMFFFIWLLFGWFGWVPTMVDIFGVAGVRTPASITVAGLLLAAISFRDC